MRGAAARMSPTRQRSFDTLAHADAHHSGSPFERATSLMSKGADDDSHLLVREVQALRMRVAQLEERIRAVNPDAVPAAVPGDEFDDDDFRYAAAFPITIN
jgi:hypothetical protein